MREGHGSKRKKEVMCGGVCWSRDSLLHLGFSAASWKKNKKKL